MFPRFLPQHSESVQLNYSDIKKSYVSRHIVLQAFRAKEL